MQTADILKITFGNIQAEASGQMAIAALLVIAGLYLMRRRH